MPASKPIEPGVIELRLTGAVELFDAMDPSPLPERDLDRDAVEFIVGWAADFARTRPLALRVHLEQAVEAGPVVAAVNAYFFRQAESAARELREHWRIARIFLGVGLCVWLIGNLGSEWVPVFWPGHAGEFVGRTLLIGGWVAMWRPLEMYLYDWWPIRRHQRLYQRLAAMPVDITTRSAV